jgi:hypothetical protein
VTNCLGDSEKVENLTKIFRFKKWPFHLVNFFMLLLMFMVIWVGKADLKAVIIFCLSIVLIILIVFFCYDLCIIVDDKSIALAKIVKGSIKKIFQKIEWDDVTEILTNRRKNNFYTVVVQRKDENRIHKLIRLHSEALYGYDELMAEVLKRARNAKTDKVTQEISHIVGSGNRG